jgi:tetratricopeptide (TPR) repeat protein
MEFRVAQYAAYKEALDSPENFSKRDETISKAAAAAIPIGVSLAIALGFEVAIPLFLAQSVNWATVLSSVALGEAADFAVQKGMDKLEFNNPALRIGASMVAGILAGGLVTGLNNKIKKVNKVLKNTEKTEELVEDVDEIARKELEKAIQSHEEDLKQLKITGQSQIERIEKTVELYNKALKGNSKDTSVWKKIGDFFLGEEEWGEAVKSYEKYLEINPNNSLIWHNKAIALSCHDVYTNKKTEVNDLVIDAYKKALEIDPKNTEAQQYLDGYLSYLSSSKEFLKNHGEHYRSMSKIDARYRGTFRVFRGKH